MALLIGPKYDGWTSMRFYLNVPLFAGYVVMATISCLGMLQLAAARGRYAGLSLITANHAVGKGIGTTLTVGAILAYVLFAPEVLTPGPAGTEVAEMFALCALFAVIITLLGADIRIQRRINVQPKTGESIELGELQSFFFRAQNLSSEIAQQENQKTPAVVLMKDPTEFVIAPPDLIKDLNQSGISVLILDFSAPLDGNEPILGATSLHNLSAALDWLEQQPGIDAKRIGLLGCGLGADAVIWASAIERRLAASLGVSPVAQSPPVQGVLSGGIEWLREISYRQAWRWRRSQATIQLAAADLALAVPRHDGANIPHGIVLGSEPNTAIIGLWPDAEFLTFPTTGHFSVLTHTHIRVVVVDWMRRKLRTI